MSRAALLAIAARQIGADGFDRTSFRGIAAEAGVSYGTVQHHFPTKQHLWSALVAEVLVPVYAESRAATPDTLGAALTERVRRRIEGAVLRPGLSAAILTDSSEGAEGRLRELVDALASTRASERQVLRTLQAAGHLRDVDEDALIAVLGIALSSLSSAKTALRVLLNLDMDDPGARERLVHGISDLLLYGLLPR